MRLFGKPLLPAASLAVLLGLAPLAPAVDLPRPAPEFAVQMPGGTQLLFSQYRGKVCLIQFLYTTCPHCQHTSQVITKIFKDMGPRGFQAIGVAFNEMAGMLVPEYVTNYQVGFPVGASPRLQVLNYLHIQTSPEERFVVPQIVMIDKKGNIRLQSPPLGDEKLQDETYLRAQIEMLLKEPAGAMHSAPAKKNP
jgi:peroxiredoxin